jgi:hypothetical protein
MKTLVLNLFGGPGTGKSTTAAGVFHKLKLAGVNCEMALEYAKDRVWEGSGHVLDNQLYVFGKQYHRIWRLLGKVDIAITDSPLLNSILYYKDENPHFPNMVTFEHSQLNNFNVFLQRVKAYNPAGRLQDEEQARKLDLQIHEILISRNEDYFSIPAVESSIDELVNMTLRRFRQLNDQS